MEGGRSFTVRNKPRVILDKRFPFVESLQVGDKGQIKAGLEVESERMQEDPDGNEVKMVTLLISKAELIEQKDTRVS